MNLWILAVSAALVVQVSAQVPTCQPPDPHGYCISQGVDNCAPEDRLITSLTDQCRTSFRFRADHILPSEWELMFDSYDYESLVGPVFLSREFDNDGDVSTVADRWEDRGGICQRSLRVCGHTLGAQDNWVFSTHIKYPPGSTTLGGGLPTEIYLNVSFRFTQCSSPCVNNFADLYRYDTNTIASESDRTDRNNYLTPLFGTGTEMTTSRLDQSGSSGTVSDTRTLTITSPSSSRTNGFHFGIRDSGNCGQINRIYLYYTPCKERQDGLVNYPELVRAPSSSLPNEGMACCAPNSHPTTSLTFRAYSASDGRCERNVRCECDAGYRLNAAGTGCQVCLAGTYRSLTDDQGACLSCPMNTAMDVEGAAICSCLNGFYRDEQTNEGPGVTCTPPPGLVRNLRTTTITSTSVSLSWTRPEVTGRDDFYYSIEYSDPNTGPFILSNGNYVNSALTVSYTVPNLRPNTPYTIRVTTHNGVSDQDTENEALRRVDLPTRTLEGVPSVPRDVQVFSGVVVWGPPAEPNGVITGYQLRFSGSSTRTVNKLPSESYHVVTDDNIRNLGSSIQVSARARTSAGSGSYSSSIQYTGNSCPPTMTPFTCPPTPTPTDCPTVTCPPTPTPTDCPTVACPPTPTPTDCPTVACPPTPTPTDCPTVTCPPPSAAPSLNYTGFECDELESLENGAVSKSNNSVGSVASYSCEPGFIISGPRERVCQLSAAWTNPSPSCESTFELKGTLFSNGSSVLLSDIGEGNNGLIFRTDFTDCCRAERIGECYGPDGGQINIRTTRNQLYRKRGRQLVRLNRQSYTGNAALPGLYCCEVPSSETETGVVVTDKVCVNIVL